MAPIESLIAGSERLLAIFGRWPSFHDAKVLEIRLVGKPKRTGDKRDRGPELSARIHTWDMTNELDTRGYYVLKNHTLVTLNFSGVEELKLEGCNHQNVIFGLTIQPKESSEAASSKFHVEFDPSFGVDAIFNCAAIEVVEAAAMPDTGPQELEHL
jgi:Immunity protein 50